ncbi:MAG: sensor histidine kinase [Lachnospiraceae bacterium]|nr:sensor histidine kinase [Lachnospiraceae bacterium]
MKKKLFATTFSKLTVAYIFFGVIPLFVLGMLFFVRFSANIRETMIRNYAQINGYFARNVEDIIESADDAMGTLYDYETEDGDTLAAVLKDDSLSEGERAVHVVDALNQTMSQSSYIASTRFADYRGQIYSVYYNQEKTLRNDAESYTRMGLISADKMRDLRILGTTEESNICVNSDDFIFVLVRNYMDTTSMDRAYNTPLGILFVDMNVDVIGDLVQKVGLDKGNIYVCNPTDGNYLYSSNQKDYLDGRNPLGENVMSHLTGTEGYGKIDDNWVFYRQIRNTDEYAVLTVNDAEAMGYYFSNRTMMAVILLFSCVVLITLYIMFSNRMSAPIRKVREAMKEVEGGQMDVHLDINTHDEMDIIADGFNKMVEKLQDYINQVYVAQICQKDAELNALKMQIQPHYLYNTLDVIRMTALDQEDEKTAELLECLAHQLRYVMGEHNERIRLQDELQMLREYFVIMKVRYEGRINLHIQISNEDLDLYILKMLLQPVVENAIKHGLREKSGEGSVAIRVSRNEDILEIVVMDDGIGMEENQVRQMQEILDVPEIGYIGEDGHVSIGMKNVYDRIKLNCGKEYGFRVESVKGMGTIVSYRLPIWEEPEDVESSDR